MLPGRLIIRLRPRMPAALRDRHPLGVMRMDSARMGIYKHTSGGNGNALRNGFFPHVHHLCPALLIKMGKIRHNQPPI